MTKGKTITQRINHRIGKFLVKRFDFFEKHFNIHVTPADYNSPIPPSAELHAGVFEKTFASIGLNMNGEDQLSLLENVFSLYIDEYTPETNSGLSLMDAFVLYCMIRIKKPRVMVEIGAGESTKISMKALDRNRHEGYPSQFYSIEPYPNDFIKNLKADHFELINRKLQDMDLSFFEETDLLFIDSSHVSRIGSDVNCEILEIIPRLKKDTYIHWHDILIPNNYWKEWVRDARLFWNESYMVHAFMLFNDSFRVMWAGHYMQRMYHEKLSQAFPFFDPSKHKLSSFWVQRIK
ncbi:MAG: class I SAM-dependent methyltransferase [Candidatus Omnitrophota bacterium]